MEDLKAQVDLLRQKALRGDLTLEECKKAVEFCRMHRGRVVSRPTKGKASTLGVSSDDLLKGL